MRAYRWNVFAATCIAIFLVGCGGDAPTSNEGSSGGSGTGGVPESDAKSLDDPDGDGGANPADSSTGSTAGDDTRSVGTDATDPERDASRLSDADTARRIHDPGPCEAEPLEPDPIDPDQRQFALALFHYNIEYVIGGLETTDMEGNPAYFAGQQSLAEGWDNDAVEDWIITETLAPILDLYEAHPTWRVNIEMQGYMVEVMAARHPAVLNQLRTLAHNNQVELISFHWAAQLFLAYPREDLQRSIDRTKAVFEEYCLPLSGVVFNQEGQAGEGRQQMLVDNGYTIGVFPKNLFRYAQGEVARWPYYQSRGGTLIVGPGEVDPASGIDLAWAFFDDGEVLSVPAGMNPYFAPVATMDAERVAEYETKLAQLEADGYKITHISDYVHQLEGMALDRPEAPPLLDGTWQPPSTDSIHRWMGGRSVVWHEVERDNDVRSGNALARMHVAATQTLVDHAAEQGKDTAELDERMSVAWQNLWHAEVSDGTGVNPWLGEILYCVRMNDWLLEETTEIRSLALDLLDSSHASVDLADGSVTLTTAGPQEEQPPPALAPLEVTLNADGRDIDHSWTQIAPGVTRLSVTFSAPVVNSCVGCDLRSVTVAFPRFHDVVEYSPGLLEDEIVTHPLSSFDLLMDEVYLPLANGLIGLGAGWYAIKHTRNVHIAARIRPDTPTVDFNDNTIPGAEGALWVFDVLQGTPEEALSWANRINIHPVVHY